MAPLDRPHTSSYSPFTVNMSLSSTVTEILEYWRDLEIWGYSGHVIEKLRCRREAVPCFVSVSNFNSRPYNTLTASSVSDLPLRTHSVPFSSSWLSMLVVINMPGGLCGKLNGRPTQLLFYCISHRSDSQIFVDIIASFAYPTYIRRPVRGVPVGILPWRLVLYGEKTRMVWLPDAKKLLKICLLVSTESTNVTDGQTDIAWRQPRLHSIAW